MILTKESVNNHSELLGMLVGQWMRREKFHKELADRVMFMFALLFTSVELLIDVEEAAWKLLEAVHRDETGDTEYKALFAAVRRYRDAFREGQ